MTQDSCMVIDLVDGTEEIKDDDSPQSGERSAGTSILVNLGSGAERWENGFSLQGRVRTARDKKSGSEFVYRLHLEMVDGNVTRKAIIYGRKVKTVFNLDGSPFAFVVSTVGRYVHQLIGKLVVEDIISDGLSTAPTLIFETDNHRISYKMMPYEAVTTRSLGPLLGEFDNFMIY